MMKYRIIEQWNDRPGTTLIAVTNFKGVADKLADISADVFGNGDDLTVVVNTAPEAEIISRKNRKPYTSQGKQEV